jgi:hypothetical protein
MRMTTLVTASTLAFGLLSGSALAQPVNANNLVSVNLSNIRVELTDVLDVEDNQIPVTVQAPIGVAATVCNLQANVLASQNKADGAKCTAESTSQALNQIVQRQIDG